MFIKDIKNKLDDGSGEITFTNYCFAMEEQNPDNDEEAFYKETFRTFSKDKDGCIPPDEMRFVFQYLGVSLIILIQLNIFKVDFSDEGF